MSNKTKNSNKRAYTQRARAVRRAEVHRRITMAAVHLHESVGPAQTTIKEIARLAGVRRATVYNHFPTDLQLLDSCSSHWFSENPPPDPTGWVAISDPIERIRTALHAMYDYYEHGREMLGKVFRDTPQVPALQEILRLKWWPLAELMIGILSQGLSDSGNDKSRPLENWDQQPAESQNENLELDASLRVALDFFTWKTLSSSGLSNRRAAHLAATWIKAGVESTP